MTQTVRVVKLLASARQLCKLFKKRRRCSFAYAFEFLLFDASIWNGCKFVICSTGLIYKVEGL